MKFFLVLAALVLVGCKEPVATSTVPVEPVSESKDMESEIVEEVVLESEAVEEVPELVEEPVEVIEEVAAVEEPEEMLTEEEAVAYEAERVEAEQAQEVRKEQIKKEAFSQTKTGSFVGIAPGHSAAGTVIVKESDDKVMIELGSDFSADKGPDLYVTLTQEQPLTGKDPVKLDKSKVMRVEALASQNGAQVYEVSKSDFEAHSHAVLIWCNKYNVLFGAAVLK